MKKPSFFSQLGRWISSHKIGTVIVILIILAGGYYVYGKVSGSSTATQYVLSPARMGTITQTVTGSGQVIAENQLDVTSEVSAKITGINVSVGQHVRKGDLLATLDSHDAAISLESARIAYTKLVQPAKVGDLTNSRNTVTKAYSDGFNSSADLYLDLPAVLAGIKDTLYGSSGFLSDQKSSYLISTARTYRDVAVSSYDQILQQYPRSLAIYKNLNHNSATSSISALISDSANMAKLVSTALQNIQTAITFISTAQPDYYPTTASSATADVATWSNQINSDLSALISAQNSIASAENSLSTLVEGADSLDIRSQKLSLQQAEETYAKYFIRAPFDGIVGRIPVSVYSQASASTVIATIVGDSKIANISLNEVDAAKVKSGQTVKITFDAIDGLNATGTVDHVDLVGTVSQGVVSYSTRVIVGTKDERIKPGMSMNVSIITKEKPGVLVVPSTAVKTQGKQTYVETLAVEMNASSTQRFNGNFQRQASSTSSEIPQGGFNGTGRTITTTSTVAPTQVQVTIGDSDDTNTEITGGLERGQLVVTRTISSGTATTATPNIFSAVGGNRAGAGGANTRALTR